LHKIELTTEQLNVVGQALGELPFKISAPVWSAIQAQVQAAQAPAETPDAAQTE
jgi:hypothetical protein